jgi:hypothetical protein
MKLLKPMILGIPKSQLKKVLSNAKTETDLYELIKDDEVTIAEFFNLKLSGLILAKAIFVSFTDNTILAFARNLINEEFCLTRYKDWKEFRKINPSASAGSDFLKVKYGESWSKHAEELKSNRPNPYSIDHWIKKHNMALTEAEARVAEYKKSTSQPLELWIKKYGEVEGKRRHSYQHRFHLNYDKIWNGDLEGKKKYTRETNRCTIDFWIKRGKTADEAKLEVSKTQKATSGFHKEYWRTKGLTEDQISELWIIFNAKKDGSSLKYFQNTYGNEEGEEKYLMNCLIKSSCWRKHKKMAEDLYPGFYGYHNGVTRFTSHSKKLMDPCPGIQGRNIGNYQVDHMFSVIEGYKQNIPPEIIGSICNLEWLETTINTSKQGKCSQTLKELLEKYENSKNKTKC